MTQQQLSAASGLQQSDISKLERGESLTTTKLVALASALGADPAWLDSGQGGWKASAPQPPATLSFLALNGLEGQLITMYRGLPPEIQERVMAAVNNLYGRFHPAPSAANPFPGAATVGDADSQFHSI